MECGEWAGWVGGTWKWGAQLDVIGTVQRYFLSILLYGLLKTCTCTYKIRHLHSPTENLHSPTENRFRSEM